eukprot:m.73729 g.73729  ORF g.73729 m.73729 type:complete len:73 (+) comp24589_c0_seq1:873-1091(+)
MRDRLPLLTCVDFRACVPNSQKYLPKIQDQQQKARSQTTKIEKDNSNKPALNTPTEEFDNIHNHIENSQFRN